MYICYRIIESLTKRRCEMNCAKRNLPYMRQYVIVAVYDILDKDGVHKYKKTDASTIVAEMSVYGNKSVFSISVSEQICGTELIVSLVQPYEGFQTVDKRY